MTDYINQGKGRSSDSLTLKPKCVIQVKNTKVERIQQLNELGFNTPLMFFVSKNPTGYERDAELEAAMIWASKMDSKNKKLNIRTYDIKHNVHREQEKYLESARTVHITEIDFRLLKQTLIKLIPTYNVMIDAEIPDNGRIAGTIEIDTNDFGRPTEVSCAYCEKNIRAMVRDADTLMVKPIHEVLNVTKNENQLDAHVVISKVASKIISKKMFNVNIEFTYFSEPTGTKNEHIVYWEYKPLVWECKPLVGE
jgi:hypothetical protein